MPFAPVSVKTNRDCRGAAHLAMTRSVYPTRSLRAKRSNLIAFR